MILVVDDDKAIVKALERLLARKQYRVEHAFDGVEAYDHIKHPDCKCILLDINMPRINGIELLMLMQAEGIKTPVIVMAGFDDYDEEEMKEFTNVVKYLHKPFVNDDLLKAIEAHALK